MTGHILNLARSPFFITQNSPWYSHSPQGSPGQPNAVALTSTVPHVPLSWRLPVSGPLSTSGYSHDVTCPATLLRVQPYVSHVSSTTRSVTSPSVFPRGLLTNLRWPGSQFSLPASWLYPSRLLLTQTLHSVIRPLCCVGCIFLPRGIRCKTLCTHGQ